MVWEPMSTEELAEMKPGVDRWSFWVAIISYGTGFAFLVLACLISPQCTRGM